MSVIRLIECTPALLATGLPGAAQAQCLRELAKAEPSPCADIAACLTQDSRRAPGLRFGDPRVVALVGALASTMCAVTGMTSKSLRALMTGLPGTTYTANQA